MLSPTELRELYKVLILPFGHPDPVGYVARALILSGGDPAFIGEDGTMGFMPVNLKDVEQMLGQRSDITSLEGNVMTTLTMDMMLFDKYGNIDDMIKMFHFNTTIGYDDFIDLVDDTRQEVMEILEPRRATVKDVVRVLEGRFNDAKADSTLKRLIEKII